MIPEHMLSSAWCEQGGAKGVADRAMRHAPLENS
jgi:hypothetical protein